MATRHRPNWAKPIDSVTWRQLKECQEGRRMPSLKQLRADVEFQQSVLGKSCLVCASAMRQVEEASR